MKTAKKTRIPSLRQCNGRGLVCLNGKRIYLGRYGAPDTQDAYERAISEWLANKQLPQVSKDNITIGELCLEYWNHCEEYYSKPDGTYTSSIDKVKQAIRPVRKLYGSTLANDFGARALRTIQNSWVEKELTRKTINDYMKVIAQMFKWAASHEKVDIMVYHSVATVGNLKAGRSNAKESIPIKPVLESHIDAIRPYVSRQVWALVQLQLLTGTRAGELLKLRACDLNVSSKIWVAELTEHKTSHIGKSRTLYFGPRAQTILKQFMNTKGIQEYLFSPKDARIEQCSQAPTHRRDNQEKTPVSTDRTIRDYYDTASYRRAITRACRKAGVPDWTPHRLRHNAATQIRRDYGLEAAQIILGHSKADVTQLYAERDETKALSVIQEIG